MSVLHRTRRRAAEAPPPGPPVPADQPTPRSVPADMPTSATTSRVPRTRIGAAWFGICAAALTGVVLIVFMLQNTGSVKVSFLWMEGSLPLALALLIAGVGVGILAMVAGTARMTQLRHLFRQRH
jgi:putative membrane protein